MPTRNGVCKGCVARSLCGLNLVCDLWRASQDKRHITDADRADRGLNIGLMAPLPVAAGITGD